eukprot:410782-Rhodomonas_salina.1
MLTHFLLLFPLLPFLNLCFFLFFSPPHLLFSLVAPHASALASSHCARRQTSSTPSLSSERRHTPPFAAHTPPGSTKREVSRVTIAVCAQTDGSSPPPRPSSCAQTSHPTPPSLARASALLTLWGASASAQACAPPRTSYGSLLAKSILAALHRKGRPCTDRSFRILCRHVGISKACGESSARQSMLAPRRPPAGILTVSSNQSRNFEAAFVSDLGAERLKRGKRRIVD